jgi:hypothetical protein
LHGLFQIKVENKTNKMKFKNEPEFFQHMKERFRQFDEDARLLREGKGHLDHPEDLVILSDVAGANQAISSILATAKNPKTITIKWDGYPALIFGHGPDRKFSIMDKHMFNKKDLSGRKVYSPEQFIEYDRARGVDRGELNNIITNIWAGLQKASEGTQGYYWGDMLFGQPLKEQNGLYKFKANPNGIAYTVDADSEIGKLITGKTAGIAVHQFIPADAATTDESTPLNGSIGQLKNNSDVAIIPSAMPIVPSVKLDQGLVNNAKSAVKQYGNAVKKLMQAPQARNTFNQLFTTYINKKIVSGDLSNLASDFMDYFESRPMTPSMKQKLSDHINANKAGIEGLFNIWVAVYNLKNQVVEQLAKQAEQSPVKGYLQSGQQSQEGFVSNGLKFVDRMGFSRQNLAGQR